MCHTWRLPLACWGTSMSHAVACCKHVSAPACMHGLGGWDCGLSSQLFGTRTKEDWEQDSLCLLASALCVAYLCDTRTPSAAAEGLALPGEQNTPQKLKIIIRMSLFPGGTSGRQEPVSYSVWVGRGLWQPSQQLRHGTGKTGLALMAL